VNRKSRENGSQAKYLSS